MKPITKYMTVAIAAVLSLIAAAPCAADVPNPTPIDLPPGDNYSDAYAINAAGQVVGHYYYGGYEEAVAKPVIWQNGVINELPLPAESGEGTAVSINALGQIVGRCRVPAPDGSVDYQACLWTPSPGGWTVSVLGRPEGYERCVATKINNAGQVLGQAEKWDYANGGSLDVGCVWNGTSWTVLMDGETPLIHLVQMNERGQILAREWDGSLVLWDNGKVTPITSRAEYTSMNNLGQVLCSYYDSQDRRHVSILYLPEAAYGLEAGLHTFSGDFSYRAINDTGLIVSARWVIQWNQTSERDEFVGTELTTGRLNEAPVFSCFLPGEIWSELNLNANAEVSALLNTIDHGLAGFYASPASVVLLAGLVQNDPESKVTAMNDSGVIIGRTRGHAILWGKVQTAENHPPVANAGLDQVLQATGATTAATLDGSASSDFDRDTLTYSWTENGTQIATGAQPSVDLAPGIHTISLTVIDPSGASSTDTVTVSVFYSWSAVLQPVNMDGSSVFKAGSTVPVKFSLAGGSAGITDLQARLSCALVSSSVVGPINESDSTSAATTGDLFRYDPTTGQYIFNWSSKGLTPGTYRLFVELGDGVKYTVDVGLR